MFQLHITRDILNFDLNSIRRYKTDQRSGKRASLPRLTPLRTVHEREFIRVVMNNSEKELVKELRLSQKEYEQAQAQARIAAIDKIIQKLNGDNVMDKTPVETRLPYSRLKRSMVTESNGFRFFTTV